MKRACHLIVLFMLLCAPVLNAQDSVRVQLHGAVLDAISQEPLYEVLVECYDVNGERKALSQTNSDGNFAFFLNARSTVELRVKENGYEDLVQQVPPFGPGESAREHVLRLVPK